MEVISEKESEDEHDEFLDEFESVKTPSPSLSINSVIGAKQLSTSSDETDSASESKIVISKFSCLSKTSPTGSAYFDDISSSRQFFKLSKAEFGFENILENKSEKDFLKELESGILE